jgi:hypothetical protein
MSKDIFGNYSPPLTPEERKYIIPHVDSYLVNRTKENIAQSLSGCDDIVKLGAKFSGTPIEFFKEMYSHNNYKETIDLYLSVYINIINIFVETFGYVKELDHQKLLEITVEVPKDGNIPVVRLNHLVLRLISKTEPITIDYDKILDGKLISVFSTLANNSPELLIINEADKPIIEFNNRIKTIANDWGNYEDYTDIIKEIIQQTKEGKL